MLYIIFGGIKKFDLYNDFFFSLNYVKTELVIL